MIDENRSVNKIHSTTWAWKRNKYAAPIRAWKCNFQQPQRMYWLLWPLLTVSSLTAICSLELSFFVNVKYDGPRSESKISEDQWGPMSTMSERTKPTQWGSWSAKETQCLWKGDLFVYYSLKVQIKIVCLTRISKQVKKNLRLRNILRYDWPRRGRKQPEKN